jgi:hypothetical protein
MRKFVGVLAIAAGCACLSSGAPMIGSVAHAGVVAGNGSCYGTNPPDGAANVGKYCGKGGGGATGSSCTCGVFIETPEA